MGVGAAQYGPVKQASHGEIGPVKGAAGNLVHSVVAHRPRADNAELLILQHNV